MEMLFVGAQNMFRRIRIDPDDALGTDLNSAVLRHIKIVITGLVLLPAVVVLEYR